jgi:type I restriction enzyme R subunit
MREGVITEADTCREFVTPKLIEAGWGAAPHAVGEQRSFTNGRIIVAGGKVRRGKQKRADYLLYYRRDYPLAVVEAKEIGLPAETGVQQAREYAEILGLKFAYATNGHRIIEIDYTAGTEREVDRYATPDELFSRLTGAAHLPQQAASHLLEPFNLVSGTDRFAKTLVFCVDQEHAAEMRQELVNLNSDLVKQYPEYVCRVTADEGSIGLTHLAHFQDVDKPAPVILTTSQLLTTGVDAEMVKNVVLARVVGSRTEFKQIVGRGTRLKVDYGKEYFNIIDFTGTATRHFADPDFDGEPARIEEVTVDESGEQVSVTGIEPETSPETQPVAYEVPVEQIGPDAGGLLINEPPAEPRKFYIDGGEVEVIGHLVYDLDTDGKKLQVVKYTEYSGRAVRTLYPTREALQSAWADPDTRVEVLRELTERGISFEELAASSDQPDADPFDLLCHLAWNAPLLTRRQRAEAARRQTQDLFAQYGEAAREILALLLERYVERGILQFSTLSDLMKVRPFDSYGSPAEIATRHFGGVRGMKDAVTRLQSALYH